MYGTLNYATSREPDQKRWGMLLILSLLSGLNQAICYTYAPVATLFEQHWHGRVRCFFLFLSFAKQFVCSYTPPCSSPSISLPTFRFPLSDHGSPTDLVYEQR